MWCLCSLRIVAWSKGVALEGGFGLHEFRWKAPSSCCHERKKVEKKLSPAVYRQQLRRIDRVVPKSAAVIPMEHERLSLNGRLFDAPPVGSINAADSSILPEKLCWTPHEVTLCQRSYSHTRTMSHTSPLLHGMAYLEVFAVTDKSFTTRNFGQRKSQLLSMAEVIANCR